MKQRWGITAVGLVCLVAAIWIHANATQAEIANKLVRFHVVANSELPWDQTLKLKVRDAVVTHAESITRSAVNRSEAKALLRQALPKLEETANRVLQHAGAQYRAQASFSSGYFPTKSYAGFRLPAGEYEAVTLTLGSGKGRNFWCVLFPPLCISPVSVREAAKLSDAEAALLCDSDSATQYKFLLVELAGKFKHAVKSNFN